MDGVGSEISLVAWMQPRGDLEILWSCLTISNVSLIAQGVPCMWFDVLQSHDHYNLQHIIWRHQNAIDDVDKAQWHNG
jgi:hypothetical protein